MVEWIMQFGSSVEVLEPEILKEKIRGEIEKMKAIYT
jgi:predicted DNA-binding transcriptional regulator YafY